jgi:catechol 2,3-dioxygenase-like lactoylglutathione lyase family enzyme
MEGTMSLSNYSVGAVIAVTDMARAKEFYEGQLGLSGGEEQADGGCSYPCGGGTTLHVYPSPSHAGKATATLASWSVDDVEQVVGDLSSKGVRFEQYDEPQFSTDERGIVSLGDSRGAWFKDPDGNTLAVFQM